MFYLEIFTEKSRESSLREQGAERELGWSTPNEVNILVSNLCSYKPQKPNFKQKINKMNITQSIKKKPKQTT